MVLGVIAGASEVAAVVEAAWKCFVRDITLPAFHNGLKLE